MLSGALLLVGGVGVALARTALNEALEAASAVLLVVGAFSGLCALGLLSTAASAAKSARRLSGDLGATAFGSIDRAAPVRQALLGALAVEGPFDSTRVVRRRWRRAFERVRRPVPALVAERFVHAFRSPDEPIEGVVRPALGSMAMVGALLVACAGVMVFSTLAFTIGPGAPALLFVMQFVAGPLVLLLLLAAVIGLIFGGTPWMRRVAALFGGSVEITSEGIVDRRGRCWSPRGSILVLQPASDSGRSAIVRLVGPAGVRRIRVGSAASFEASRLLEAWGRWVDHLHEEQASATEGGVTHELESTEVTRQAEEWLSGGVGLKQLEEEIPAAVAPASWRHGEDDAAVVTISTPLLRPIGSWALLRDIGLLLLVQVAVLGAMLAVDPIVVIASVSTCVPALILLAPTIIAVVRFIRAERDRMTAQRAAQRIIADPSSTDASRAIVRCLVDRPIFISHDKEALRWMDAVASLAPKPLALVAPALALEVRSLGRTERFLEPHPIQPGAIGSQMLGAAVTNAAIAGILFVIGARWFAIIMAFVAIVTLVRVPFIWYRLPLTRSGRRSFVAGPGCLRDPKDRTWTVRDSTILITPAAEQGGVLVRLIGPAGVRDIRFLSPADPEFIALWRLWTHRDPRPELVTAL